MFYFLSKTLDIFLSPLTWAIALALVGLHRGRAKWTRWAPAGSAALLCFFALPPVANALVRHLETSALRTMRPGVTYDAVILLGGAVDHGATASWGTPSFNDNVERLLVTFDLLRTGQARHAIVSGGRAGPDDPVVEARTLADQLVRWGIDKSRLVLDTEARNTRENAVHCRSIAASRGFRSLLVVTSAFHMPRSLDAFRKVDLAVDALPVDHRSYDPAKMSGSWLPRTGSFDESTHALREIFGRWIYRLAW